MWAHSYLLPWDYPRSVLGEATALHLAAMLGIPEICEWLVEEGHDVNRHSVFGSPLRCAVLTTELFRNGPVWSIDTIAIPDIRSQSRDRQLITVDLLLNAGCNPNLRYGVGEQHQSILQLALKCPKPVALAMRLLKKGALFTGQDLENVVLKCEGDDEGRSFRSISFRYE